MAVSESDISSLILVVLGGRELLLQQTLLEKALFLKVLVDSPPFVLFPLHRLFPVLLHFTLLTV